MSGGPWLTTAAKESISVLLDEGWSCARIARAFCWHRTTVTKYVALMGLLNKRRSWSPAWGYRASGDGQPRSGQGSATWEPGSPSGA